MEYISTRDKSKQSYTSAQVIKMGLAPDGGLFVPANIPHISMDEIAAMRYDSYIMRATKILSKYLTDYTFDEIYEDCSNAYSEKSFPDGAAMTVRITDSLYALELWHGPTAAFKDMALQLMPRLLSRSLSKTGEDRDALILVATSGDTGKAALEGFKDVDRTRISVFYPVDGVSRVQKLQMQTQEGGNVNVCAINGNFDDAQSGVKKIFSDLDFSNELLNHGYFLSSANSINWGRLVPQTVYYFSAYCDLISSGEINAGDTVNICVPTGNFGNIFAAYLAKLMGLPVGKLICASNKNNILTDFLNSGVYDRNRSFHCTMSPSMDILISSNLERLLYLCTGSEKTAEYMNALAQSGRYEIDPETLERINNDFVGYFCDECSTADTVKKFYDTYGYLSDTHTAVALNCALQYRDGSGDSTPMIVASTASPYKFANDVYTSLSGHIAGSDLSALNELSTLTNTPITYPLRDLDKRSIRFDTVIDPEDMQKAARSAVMDM